MRPLRSAILALLLIALPLAARAAGVTSKRIGEVHTTFRVLGRNDRIVVDRYDDPHVQGVSCYVSRAVTGGVSGSLGLATDPSRFSISCRATGPITIEKDLPENEIVFDAAANWLFKEIRVSRLYDKEKQVLVYLVWSTKAMSRGGSPFNAIAAVPLTAQATPTPTPPAPQ
jgi:CreA protein